MVHVKRGSEIDSTCYSEQKIWFLNLERVFHRFQSRQPDRVKYVWVLKSDRSEMESCFCYVFAVCPWANYFTSLILFPPL